MTEKYPIGIAGPDLNQISRDYTHLVATHERFALAMIANSWRAFQDNLHETEPVWLPDYALKESGPNLRTAAGAAALTLGLAKELSGETQFERARQHACICEQHSDKQVFAQVTEERFNGVRRCC